MNHIFLDDTINYCESGSEEERYDSDFVYEPDKYQTRRLPTSPPNDFSTVNLFS